MLLVFYLEGLFLPWVVSHSGTGMSDGHPLLGRIMAQAAQENTVLALGGQKDTEMWIPG